MSNTNTLGADEFYEVTPVGVVREAVAGLIEFAKDNYGHEAVSIDSYKVRVLPDDEQDHSVDEDGCVYIDLELDFEITLDYGSKVGVTHEVSCSFADDEYDEFMSIGLRKVSEIFSQIKGESK